MNTVKHLVEITVATHCKENRAAAAGKEVETGESHVFIGTKITTLNSKAVDQEINLHNIYIVDKQMSVLIFSSKFAHI